MLPSPSNQQPQQQPVQLTEQQLRGQTLFNVISAQRNTAWDALAQAEVEIAMLRHQLANLPVQQEPILPTKIENKE